MFTGDLIEKLMEKDVVDCQVEGKNVVDAILESIQETLVDGQDVPIRYFGRFYTIDMNERNYRHPQSGELLSIPSRSYVRFKPSKFVNGMVN